jgi:hypothetical protein
METMRGRHHPYQPISSASRHQPISSASKEGSFYLLSKVSSRQGSFFENNIEYEKEGNNVISYDIGSLFCHGCWDKSSPFNKRLIGILMLEVIISTILGYFKCAKGVDSFYCVPLPDNTTGLTLLTITSFLVGIFSNNVLQRWWSIRVALGFVINKSKSLAVAITSVVAYATVSSSPEIREEALQLICKIYRYLSLAHALIYKCADGSEDLSDLIARRLITSEEADILLLSKKIEVSKQLFQTDVESCNMDDNTTHMTNLERSTPCFSPFHVSRSAWL